MNILDVIQSFSPDTTIIELTLCKMVHVTKPQNIDWKLCGFVIAIELMVLLVERIRG